MLNSSAAILPDQRNQDSNWWCASSGGIMKLIAIITMFIDHVGVVFFPNVFELRVIGRIAFPIYAWCVATGADRTRSIPKYALRLFIMMVVSQPFYMLALNHEIIELNVFATLLLGLLAVWGIKEKRFLSHIWAPLLAILVTLFVDMDYSWRGVLLIILMYLLKGNKVRLAAGFTAFCLYWGTTSSLLRSFCGVSLVPLYIVNSQSAVNLFSVIFRIQFFGVLALPFILTKFKRDFRLPKWISYAVYPMHLAIIWLVKIYLKI